MSESQFQKAEKKIKVTFFNKNKLKCPICEQEFLKEELLSGRGRLIAGEINSELRQIYTASKKYGKLFPLIYGILTCPRCLFSVFPEDFDLPVKNTLLKIKAHTQDRLNLKKELFDANLSFNTNRNLKHGILGYILATSVYSFYDRKYAPTLKKAISSLRAAWLYNDLIEELKNEGNNEKNKNIILAYETCKDIFYRKSSEFYDIAIQFSENGGELFDQIKNYGPDLDNNFGYSGMLYMSVLLKGRILHELDIDQRLKILMDGKKIVSKIFGIGKSNKSKPSILLNFAQKLFTQLSEQLKSLESLLKEK